MKVKFSQKVDIVKWNDDDEEIYITDPTILKSMHGIEYVDEIFSDYLLDGDSDREKFQNLGIEGGKISFEYLDNKNEVIVHTEYNTSEVLSKKDIENLKEYTGSQWTDGIGSSYSQNFESDLEIFPSFIGCSDIISVEIIS